MLLPALVHAGGIQDAIVEVTEASEELDGEENAASKSLDAGADAADSNADQETVEEEFPLLTLFVRQDLLIRIGIAAVIVIIQIILIRVVLKQFARLSGWIQDKGQKSIRPISFKQYRLMEAHHILAILIFMVKIIKYLVIIVQLYLTLPIVLLMFEPTRGLASSLFGYILNPLKDTLVALINYIPKLITIAVILFLVRYVMKGVRFFSDQIAQGKLVIPGFYEDWAAPTFNIIRILLYAFTIIVIYPYLPGSESAVFQGVSVFVGVIFSLSSSSAIGNIVAGVVITYMRPFKIGDRIKIGDITGFVVEKSAAVTRIRTTKNEFISFPNQSILNATITNYNFSVEQSDGLILHTDVTMTYAVHWTTMYNILLSAARKTVYVLEQPAPYVFQKAPEDNYARYELNVYIKEVSKISVIFSDLHNHLQDEFRAANIDMTAPFFYTSAMPSEQRPAEELRYSPFPSKPEALVEKEVEPEKDGE
ncbi:MAG: mechanosensitive ion channel family protein [Treponema sp.]|nr:mechanosensitive ion channel family protein [Treponema sp.]